MARKDKSPIIEIKCASCGQMFKEKQIRKDQGRKYCSRECYKNDKGIV